MSALNMSEPPKTLTSISDCPIPRSVNSFNIRFIEHSTYLNPLSQVLPQRSFFLHIGSIPWQMAPILRRGLKNVTDMHEPSTVVTEAALSEINISPGCK